MNYPPYSFFLLTDFIHLHSAISSKKRTSSFFVSLLSPWNCRIMDSTVQFAYTTIKCRWADVQCTLHIVHHSQFLRANNLIKLKCEIICYFYNFKSFFDRLHDSTLHTFIQRNKQNKFIRNWRCIVCCHANDKHFVYWMRYYIRKFNCLSNGACFHFNLITFSMVFC